MAFKPCLLSCLYTRGYLLDFSEPTEKSGVWISRTSDSVFHLLFLGKGLEQAREMHWPDAAPNLSICLNRSKTYSQGTGPGAHQHRAAGIPAPPLSCGFSPKVTNEQGNSSLALSCLWLMLLLMFLLVLQSLAGGKGKQNTRFLFETPLNEASQAEPIKAGGSALPPFQEGLRVIQAQPREGLPACPTPGLGSALGGHCSESQYLPVWFYQFFAPAPRHFSLLPSAQADFYTAPELDSSKVCQVP